MLRTSFPPIFSGETLSLILYYTYKQAFLYVKKHKQVIKVEARYCFFYFFKFFFAKYLHIINISSTFVNVKTEVVKLLYYK